MQPTPQELNESIEALKSYRNRLRSEIINISQKLRMSQPKIEESLNKNSELNNIEITLKKLISDNNANN
ncbi:hypothetical protein [Prochlorococcus marinus]|uniref:hypothetical protein n=1 Tax=Prochlorococcus marinus TaxID=1219 RepID=UPI0022B487B4|nr:hypothetical protein [Prochlorococcus marinus]